MPKMKTAELNRINRVATDISAMIYFDNKCGKIVQKGEVKYFHRGRFFAPKDLGSHNPPRSGEWLINQVYDGGGGKDCEVHVGDIPSTNDPNKASFWSKANVDPPVITRAHSITWICCPCRPVEFNREVSPQMPVAGEKGLTK